jgi:hypothetical protein
MPLNERPEYGRTAAFAIPREPPGEASCAGRYKQNSMRGKPAPSATPAIDDDRSVSSAADDCGCCMTACQRLR